MSRMSDKLQVTFINVLQHFGMLYSADSEQCKAVLLNELYANYRIDTLELQIGVSLFSSLICQKI